MRTHVLIERLEALDYLFVTVVDESPEGAKLTAVDPAGYQIEIEVTQDLVVDRVIGSQFWDIMFIGEESFL
jgi:hypothetical protein